MKQISEFKEKDKIREKLLVTNCVKGVTNSGLSYLNMELRDASGAINAKKWDVSKEDESIFIDGKVVEIYGEIILYKSSLQMKILDAMEVDENEIDMSSFAKASPYSLEILKNKLLHHFNSIVDPDIKLLTKNMLERFGQKVYSYPAAITIHHDYERGLLTHITSMCDLAEFIVNNYPYSEINKDLLIAGVIIHDLGKIEEYEGPVVFKKTLEGKLIGHISIVTDVLKEECSKINFQNDEIPVLLEHMILSHHGQLEFGSPVLPLTKEAMLLSLIDNLDSRIVALDKVMENVKPGEFSQKVFALENRSFYKPKN
ncbi:MAG: 3'-5' exoribonuclease YhaM family protein [Bacilli bacterium]